MELDRNQPSESGLRETLAPWYDHAAAWVVLLCVGLTVFSAISAFVVAGADDQLASLLARIAVTVAAMSAAWRASSLPELKSERSRAWRWLAFALAIQLAATLAIPAAQSFDYRAVQAAS